MVRFYGIAFAACTLAAAAGQAIADPPSGGVGQGGPSPDHHFLPNGQISAVTNMTHGWSRAVFDVPVAYKEDVDRVMGVLAELGQELREDPAYADKILEDLTMLGVDALGDSAITIKFFIKTRPMQQWAVKRELLRRIKNRFDELGIEIPFLHRIVFHRLEDGVADRSPASPARFRGGAVTGPRSAT